MAMNKFLDNEIENKFSHLLGKLTCADTSMPHCGNVSDSDDLFENIAGNKNITFSRAKKLYCDDLQMYPVTPKSLRNTSITDNQENEPEGLIKRKTVMKKNLRSTRHSKNEQKSDESILSEVSLFSPVNSITMRDSMSSPLNTSSNKLIDLSNMRNDSSISNNNIGATSTPSNSSSTTCNSNNVDNILTPKVSSTISSMKRYTLMKAARSAQKTIKDIMGKATLQNQKERVESPGIIKTPGVSECNNSNSSLNTPKTVLLSESTVETIDKTPIIRRSNTSSAIMTGVKKLPEQNSRAKVYSESPCSQLINKFFKSKEVEGDEDFPATQPISSILLRGVVAYVEVRTGGVYYSGGTKSELESMGAKVENNFTKKVTHCFFHNGRMSTYKKAIELKVPLLSIYWIIACKDQLRKVPIEGYEPDGLDKYKEGLIQHQLKPKVRRPMTDSKLHSKRRNPGTHKGKASRYAAKCTALTDTSVEGGEIIGALHSVAGDIKKASEKFDHILSSPELQKATKQLNCCGNQPYYARKSPKSSNQNNKRNKKLVFGSSSDDELKNVHDSNNVTKDCNVVIPDTRVSYDSDDMLDYAKKQAAQTRCSAPPRLLTSRKCKKLISSCNKPPGPGGNNMDEAISVADLNKTDNVQTSTTLVTTRRQSRSKVSPSKRFTNFIKPQIDKNTDNKPKLRKRKLLLPSEVIEAFAQDSGESTPDFSNECPYKTSPNKKQKNVAPKTKVAKTLAPLMSSDWESEDSTSRSHRESSALFVKKGKKVNLHRNIPTIVCTSLHRRDVEVVTSIVASLGKFAVEATVSEQTTHVVTSSPRRTINLLKGIARGCWILNIKWIYESLESNKWLHEERFELLEFSPSVRQSRVERQAFGPEFNLELFKNLGPYFVCRTTVPPAKDLTDLLRLCGGIVVTNARAAKIIIGTAAPHSPTGHCPLLIKEKWVLDCISQLRQLDPHNYVAVQPER